MLFHLQRQQQAGTKSSLLGGEPGWGLPSHFSQDVTWGKSLVLSTFFFLSYLTRKPD